MIKFGLLLVSVVVVGLHAKNLLQDELLEKDIVLPSVANKVRSSCLKSDNLDAIVNDIPEAEKAKKKNYVCAFVAFQNSDLKETPIYGLDNVDERFENFIKCVRDVQRFNSEDDLASYVVNKFCDMTEEEKESRLGRLVIDGGFGRGK